MEVFYYDIKVDQNLINHVLEPLNKLPELSIIYMNLSDHITFNNKKHVKIILNVNGNIIKISNRDDINDYVNTIVHGNYIYTFQGSNLILNHNQLFLRTKITRSPVGFNSNLSNNNDKLLVEDKKYGLGQPFIVELESNPGTGYSWEVVNHEGLNIVYQGTSNTCKNGMVGCPQTNYYVLVGTQKGPATFSAKYVRPWEALANNDAKNKEFNFIII